MINAATFLWQYLRHKGICSTSMIRNAAKECLLFTGNDSHYPLFTLVYPLVIIGVIEFSHKGWFLSKPTIISGNNEYLCVNVILNNKLLIYQKVDNITMDTKTISNEVGMHILKAIPSVRTPEFFAQNVLYNGPIYKKGRRVQEPLEGVLYSGGDKLYSSKYMKWAGDWWALPPYDRNPDAYNWARLFEKPNYLYKDNILSWKKSTLPFIIGRALSILTMQRLSNYFQDDYKFNVNNDVYSEIQRILPKG